MNILSAFRNLCSGDSLDRDFLESYRKVLFGQYQSLTNPVANPAAKAEADKVVGMPVSEIEWDDLYRLELAIIKLEPAIALRRRAWILRNEYKEMASPEEFKDYLASKPPPAEGDNDAEALRADLVRLQEELNWRYIVVWMLETFRGLLLQRLVRWTTGVVVVALGLMCWGESVAFAGSWTNTNLPMLAAIVVSGIMGGLVSTIRRVQGARFASNADLDLTGLEQGNTSLYLSPFLGGVFALVLFFLFAGGFVTGDLFPKVNLDGLLVSGIEKLELKEVAKLIVWSFMAGFAEKFVPDRLERLTQAANQAAPAARGPGQAGN